MSQGGGVVYPRAPSRWEAVGLAFLPGLLAGTQVAGLLFFLNPALPFSSLPVTRAILFYGALLGMAGALLLAPWSWRRPECGRRILPWSLTAVLLAAAGADWYHASHFAYYLPPGINTRLIKAAVWLSLAGLACFYTALLHTLHRRAYGRRSRVGLALLALASVYVMVERREAFRPRPGAAPRPSLVEPERRPLLWVVGIEQATLDAILPLAEQGRLPFFAALLAEGAWGRLEAIEPTRGPALWTTLATGKLPWRHGLLGELEHPAGFLAPGARLRLLPAGTAFDRWGTLGGSPRLTDARSRQTLAIWEVAQRLGLAAGLVGWPASDPVPDHMAFAFSNRYFAEAESAGRSPEPGDPAAHAGSRFVAADAARRLGVPDLPAEVVAALAQDHWRQEVSLLLLETRPDVGAVFIGLPGLGEVSHRYFGGYSAVQFEGARDRRFQRAGQLVAAYYQQLDGFLGQLWGRERRPRLLAVASAYGVAPYGRWRQLWQELTGRRSAGGTTAGAPDGMLILAGEGIRPGARLEGAELADVVPTLLYGVGLPVARDLDGRVLTGAFESAFLARRPLTFVPSYETLAAPAAEAGARSQTPPSRDRVDM